MDRNLKEFKQRFENGEDASELMTEMEKVFKIPYLSNEGYNEANREVIELYRLISESRDI